jgi:hypothetical protein
MHLPQCCRPGVSLYCCGSKIGFLHIKPYRIADFAMLAVILFKLFLVGAMDKQQIGGLAMIKKKILNPDRTRRIKGGFSFIPHRFLTGGFFSSLNPHELLLYFFLVLSGDRNGLSFYGYDKICTLLQMSLDQYIQARDRLMKKDLIAFDGSIFQVLSLPTTSVRAPRHRSPRSCVRTKQPESVGQILNAVFKGPANG